MLDEVCRKIVVSLVLDFVSGSDSWDQIYFLEVVDVSEEVLFCRAIDRLEFEDAEGNCLDLMRFDLSIFFNYNHAVGLFVFEVWIRLQHFDFSSETILILKIIIENKY